MGKCRCFRYGMENAVIISICKAAGMTRSSAVMAVALPKVFIAGQIYCDRTGLCVTCVTAAAAEHRCIILRRIEDILICLRASGIGNISHRFTGPPVIAAAFVQIDPRQTAVSTAAVIERCICRPEVYRDILDIIELANVEVIEMITSEGGGAAVIGY